jgi:Ca2+/Na+ antiporter
MARPTRRYNTKFCYLSRIVVHVSLPGSAVMFLVLFAWNVLLVFEFFFFGVCCVLLIVWTFVFMLFVFLVSMSPHRNHEEDQHENIRPQDKKYTTHSKLDHDVTLKKARSNTLTHSLTHSLMELSPS